MPDTFPSSPVAGVPVQTSDHVDPFARARPLPAARLAPLVAVAAGGALGGGGRYGVDQLMAVDPAGIPWPTFTVNVAGSFVLAALLVLILEVWPPRRHLRPFLCTGFLGAFTTFSSLTVEVDQRWAHGHLYAGTSYLLISVLGGFAAGLLGLALGHRIVARGPAQRAREERV